MPASASDFVIIGVLLAINALISVALRLRLERAIGIAMVRMVLQVAALGYALKIVAMTGSMAAAGILALALVLLTSRALFVAQTYRLANRWAEITAIAVLMCVGSVVSACGAATLLHPEAWAAPARVLALFGLILGHVSTGIALVIDQLASSVLQDRRVIEARLSLGGSRFAALQPALRSAVHTAMLPVIAGLAGAGVAGMPDLMAGQVLAGADPLEATLFQIQILLLLGAATGVTVIIAGLGGVLLLTDRRHRLRTDRLSIEHPA